MISANPHIRAMAAYQLADLDSARHPTPVSLAENESLRPPSPKAVAAARAALDTAALYPDPNWTALQSALRDTYDTGGATLLCGAGSMELISSIMRSYAGPGRDVLASAYSYAFFRTAALAAGAGYVAAPEEAHRVSVDQLLAHITPATRLLCVANPGNPTGTAIPLAALQRLRANMPDDVLLVVDEAYGEFLDPYQPPALSMVSGGRTIVLRTLSKAYGLAGLRAGWGAFPEEVAREVKKTLNPNNIGSATQAAAAAAIRDQAYMHATRDETVRNRDAFTAALQHAGLSPLSSHTNFVLIPFADSAMARHVDAALQRNGLILRTMAGYGLPHCLRATIGPAKVMTEAARIIAASLKDAPG